MAELITCQEWATAYAKAVTIVSKGGILVLLGQRGNGKTQMAVELIRRACRELKTALYCRCREVGMRIRECFRQGSSASELEMLSLFVRPYLLILDECQDRADKDWEHRLLGLLIDKRYGALKPTVLVANASAEQTVLVQLFGAGAVDRLNERGGVIEFTWQSFRKPEGDWQ